MNSSESTIPPPSALRNIALRFLPRAASRRLRREHEARVIRDSGLFDEVWYQRSYGASFPVGANALHHYCSIGWKLGLNPSRRFDTAWYRSAYPDIAARGINPLYHYIAHGRAEGRLPAPMRTRPAMKFNRFYKMADLHDYVQQNGQEFGRRHLFDTNLVPTGAETFQYYAHCYVCDEPRGMQIGAGPMMVVNGRTVPILREHLMCVGCSCNNRMRAALHLLCEDLQMPPEARIYATEAITPLFRALSARFSNAVGSEYLGPGLEPGYMRDGLRHEDVTRLSFESDSLDAVLSLEVLEHVPDYRAALREFQRVLKPGGVLVFSVPFVPGANETLVRAKVGPAGTVEHIEQPEYHGNPVDTAGGSLCYYHFGWDLLQDARSAGFRDAHIRSCWSQELGYLGGEVFTFVAIK